MEIIKFILKPKETLGKDESIYQTLWKFILLIFLCLSLGIISVILIELLRNLGFIPEYIRPYNESVKSIRSNIIFIAILFPIIEELAFRLYLKRNSINVFISVFLTTYMIVTTFFFKTSHFSLEKEGLLRITISLFLAFIGLYFYRKRFLKIKFSFLYYFSAFLFGIVHIYNYDCSNPKVLLFAIIICLPQIIGGLFFGYTRIKYGIIGSIILHSLVNGLPHLIL